METSDAGIPTVPLPYIDRSGKIPRLIVDGAPFIILGLQWDCDSCFSRAEMNPLFPYAARLQANTAALPLYWREIEPEKGVFDFSMLDERLNQARKNGLRLVLLWFATWKNACSFYCPDYIQQDTMAYRRVRTLSTVESPSLCPLGDATFERDRQALTAMVAHLVETDPQHTVIMVQIENEPGVLVTARCHCEVCQRRFEMGTWAAEWGEHADEAFSTQCVAEYIERLAKAAKALYPIPYYVNVALPQEAGGIPGEYFSGGAVPWMVELFRRCAPTLDLIAPDIYTSGYREFRDLACCYETHAGPLFVAEHSSGPEDRAERNVFYATGEHGAIGFDPWAIDACYPAIDSGESFVDVATATVRPHGKWLAESYLAISRAIVPIVSAQGSERMFVVVQEDGELRAGWCAPTCDIVVEYHEPGGRARGLLIQESLDTYLLVGLGFSAFFRRRRPDGRPVLLRSAEWGYFEGEEWKCLHSIRRERAASAGLPIRMIEPGVARIGLDLERY